MATQLGNAYLQIVPSAKGIQKSITNELNGAAGNAGTMAGDTIASKIKGAIVKAGIGAALVSTVKSALSEGAALEQSLGGIEAIFGDSADAVKKYATDAWQSVGISANEYMENVTSFSAALINSMGGDTDKAAEVANQALIDMGDNANRFGTDMQSIQNAYQGFAKQNYTMLDNLKLGYGGTKSEMERLLADAEKFSGVHYDIDNLGDVYSAIHVIQEELNVTGTTAKEASATLAGSTGAMKAAWKDLLGNMAIGGDVSASVTNLVTSIKNTLSNLIPMIGRIVSTLPGALFNMVATLAPELLTAGAEFMRNMAEGVQQAIPNLVNNAMTALGSFAETLRANFGVFVDAGIELIKNIVKGIVDAIPGFIAQAPAIISNFAGLINDNAPKLLKAGKEILKSLWEGIKKAFKALKDNWRSILDALLDVWEAINWISLGKGLITSIINGIKAIAKGIPAALKSIGTTAFDWFKSIDWIGLGKSVITAIVNGLKSLISNIPTMLKNIGSTAVSAVKSIDWVGVGKAIISGIVGGLGAIATGALSIPGKLLEIGKNAVTNLVNIDWGGVGTKIVGGVRDGIGAVGNWIKEKLTGTTTEAKKAAEGVDYSSVGANIINSITSGIRSNKISTAIKLALEEGKKIANSVSFKSVGENMARGVILGLDSEIPAVKRKAEELVYSAQKKMINVSMIHSPSKLFRDTVGKYMALGVAEGLEDYIPAVQRAAEDLINESVITDIPQSVFTLGNGALDTAINGGVTEPQYVIMVNTEMDGQKIKTTVKDYVVEQVTAEQYANLRAMGAY